MVELRVSEGVEFVAETDFARMKKLVAILAAVVLSFVALVLGYRWDSSTNHGYRFGFYRDFNRVSNALASLSGITITQAWANCDITLEEFGFNATTAEGGLVRIMIGERDPIRSMSSDSLVQTLKTEIERQTRK